MKSVGFAAALNLAIHDGMKIRRAGWTNGDARVYRFGNSLVLRVSTRDAASYYAPSQQDMLANDWQDWTEPPPQKVPIASMSFELALSLLKAGCLMRRACWSGGCWRDVRLAGRQLERTSLSESTEPGWTPCTTDLLADDWEVVKH